MSFKIENGVLKKYKAEKGEISIHKGKDEDEDDSDESY